MGVILVPCHPNVKALRARSQPGAVLRTLITSARPYQAISCHDHQDLLDTSSVASSMEMWAQTGGGGLARAASNVSSTPHATTYTEHPPAIFISTPHHPFLASERRDLATSDFTMPYHDAHSHRAISWGTQRAQYVDQDSCGEEIFRFRGVIGRGEVGRKGER
ncbi:hypothetical protein PENSPDRAFT_512127 [Peniophora sp. CONT]|nr:hypothetical protein PENSPDRAFT_512127 [Peniophora sp. CONT]